MKKKGGPRQLKVFSTRNSECGSTSLFAMDWQNWFLDRNSEGEVYIHFKRFDEDTWHRVFCKFKATRIAMYGGILYWLIDRPLTEIAKRVTVR